MDRKFYLAILLLVSYCLGLSAQIDGASGASVQQAEGIKAPRVEGDMIDVSRCPTQLDGLSVRLYANEDGGINKAVISMRGEEWQTVSGKDVLATNVSVSDTDAVRFLDADFDGYVDILIGAGQPRTYSTLLVWNQSSQRFKRIDGERWQGMRLAPSSRLVYTGGGGSAFEFCIRQYRWKGRKIVLNQQLLCVDGGSDSAAQHKYTITDAKDRKITATDSAADLPSEWSVAVNAYLGE